MAGRRIERFLAGRKAAGQSKQEYQVSHVSVLSHLGGTSLRRCLQGHGCRLPGLDSLGHERPGRGLGDEDEPRPPIENRRLQPGKPQIERRPADRIADSRSAFASPRGFMSLLGLLSLAGIITNNGIETNRQASASIYDAIVTAALSRFHHNATHRVEEPYSMAIVISFGAALGTC